MLFRNVLVNKLNFETFSLRRISLGFLYVLTANAELSSVLCTNTTHLA
jgi:hypothetical protein